RFALRDDGERESYDVDALVEKAPRELRGEARVAEHHRDDRRLALLQGEARLHHALAEAPRVVHEAVAELGGAREQIEDGDRRTGDGRRDGVREEVRTRALAEQLDDRLLPRREPAGRAAERLAERRGHDVDALLDAE